MWYSIMMYSIYVNAWYGYALVHLIPNNCMQHKKTYLNPTPRVRTTLNFKCYVIAKLWTIEFHIKVSSIIGSSSYQFEIFHQANMNQFLALFILSCIAGLVKSNPFSPFFNFDSFGNPRKWESEGVYNPEHRTNALCKGKKHLISG